MAMTRTEAIEKYLKSLSKSESILNKIMAWDESKTLRENSIAVGLNFNVAHMFVRRYSLSFKKDPRGSKKYPATEWKRKAIAILRGGDHRWPITVIADAMGISKQRVEQILQQSGNY